MKKCNYFHDLERVNEEKDPQIKYILLIKYLLKAVIDLKKLDKIRINEGGVYKINRTTGNMDPDELKRGRHARVILILEDRRLSDLVQGGRNFGLLGYILIFINRLRENPNCKNIINEEPALFVQALPIMEIFHLLFSRGTTVEFLEAIKKNFEMIKQANEKRNEQEVEKLVEYVTNLDSGLLSAICPEEMKGQVEFKNYGPFFFFVYNKALAYFYLKEGLINEIDSKYEKIENLLIKNLRTEL